MTARTHDMFAFGSLITAVALFPPSAVNVPTLLTCIVGNIVGALIPDMDQATNRLWDLLPAGNFMGKVFRHLFLSHRTISHSLLGTFIIYKFLEWGLPLVFNPAYVDVHLLLMSVMIGLISHLFADALTKDGIPLFFPLEFKIGIPPLRILRVTTGSFIENWVVLPLTIVYAAIIFHEYQSVFLTLFRNMKG